MSEHASLLSELLRPQQFGDLTLPQRVIDRLQRMYDEGKIMNMLFYGPPGLGKTSAARMFFKFYFAMEINGSVETGVDFVRTRMWQFLSSVHSNCLLEPGGNPKRTTPQICFIDEADFLSANAQAALRGAIETFHEYGGRFIFAANNISKLMPAIRSRLMEICFDIAPADRPEVQRRLVERYKAKFSEHGIRYDQERLRQIVGIYYPDLRTIANRLEFEFA